MKPIDSQRQKVLLSDLKESHYQTAIRLYPYPKFHIRSMRKFLMKLFCIENDTDCIEELVTSQGIVRTIRKMPEIKIYSQSGQGERIYERI